jgi:uncharacterized protein
MRHGACANTAMKGWQMGLLKLAGAAVLLYGAVVLLLWWGQERLLFRPTAWPADHTPVLPADTHEVWIDVPGARLNAWHLRLPQPHGVVFFLHGNAGSLDSWFVNPEFYRALNLDLFMIDYRGFGKSSGHIQSEAQLHADVRAAWAHVAPLYAGKKQVLLGRSLGTGLAASLAADVQPQLTILVSAYFSMADVARDHYPWVPQATLRYPLRTDLVLPRVKGPLLLVHGAQDTLIAPSHGQRLQALVPHAQWLLLPQAGHNDVQNFLAYTQTLTQALTAATRH